MSKNEAGGKPTSYSFSSPLPSSSSSSSSSSSTPRDNNASSSSTSSSSLLQSSSDNIGPVANFLSSTKV